MKMLILTYKVILKEFIMQTKDKISILFVFHNSNIQSGATRSLIDIVDYLISTENYNISGLLSGC